MTTPPPAPTGLRVRYAPGVQLTVPIIADRDVLDELYDAVQAGTSGPQLRAYAHQLGISTPSTMHEWAIGWAHPGPEGSSRLVWYDPEKLAGITAMIERALADDEGLEVITVIQGAGWDDYGIYLREPPAPTTAPQAATGDRTPAATIPADPPPPAAPDPAAGPTVATADRAVVVELGEP